MGAGVKAGALNPDSACGPQAGLFGERSPDAGLRFLWHHFHESRVSRQLDLYPSSGWRIIQDFAAAASSIPT